MATPRKKPANNNKPVSKKAVAPRKPRTVKEEELTALDIHAIQLHEFYKSLRRAGFDVESALALIVDKNCHPNWFSTATVEDVDLLEEEEDEE